MGAPAVAGLIEGFYGRPWSWDERHELCRWCAERGMTDYVYAPKDDPKHRAEWREPYTVEELDRFEALARAGGLRLGFAVSPGLSMAYDDAGDRAVLARKLDDVVRAGAGLVVLALDDIPFGGGAQGQAHAEVTSWLRDHLGDRARLALVPTEYVGTGTSPYLDALAAGLPDDVLVGWTGQAVVNDRISRADAEARAAALGGRPPLLWDNYPVNDFGSETYLFTGPLRGRDPDLVAACEGYLANPMVQPRASKLALASVAGWLRGDEPAEAWRQDADATGWRLFAECCDGVAPVEVAAEVAAGGELTAPRAWFGAAAECEAPGLEDEVRPWLEQVRRDARLALRSLDLLEACRAAEPDLDAIVARCFDVVGRWQRSRRAAPSVMGHRLLFRPVLGQAPDGRWTVRPDALVEQDSAVDVLVRLAIAEATTLG